MRFDKVKVVDSSQLAGTTIELFEQYKQAIDMQTDRFAAQSPGVKNQIVSNWRTRGSQAEP